MPRRLLVNTCVQLFVPQSQSQSVPDLVPHEEPGLGPDLVPHLHASVAIFDIVFRIRSGTRSVVRSGILYQIWPVTALAQDLELDLALDLVPDRAPDLLLDLAPDLVPDLVLDLAPDHWIWHQIWK